VCRRKGVFAKLKVIAQATSVDLFDKAVAALQSSPEWTENPRLQEYVTNEWLSCEKIWAACFRQVGFLMPSCSMCGVHCVAVCMLLFV
jgi:hypothetical protein